MTTASTVRRRCLTFIDEVTMKVMRASIPSRMLDTAATIVPLSALRILLLRRGRLNVGVTARDVLKSRAQGVPLGWTPNG